MTAYIVGLLTIPALALFGWAAISIGQWWHWWFVHNDGRFHGGKGYLHVSDFVWSDESSKWYPRGQHGHSWPPDTPWWLIRAAEPARVWICHHGADHRPATPIPSTTDETRTP